MSSSIIDLNASAIEVRVDDELVTMTLADGRVVSAPTAWYPRLAHGSAAERQRWRLIADGRGVNWPDLDEDISVENLLFGKPSGESQTSLKRWLDARATSSP
jgi:Protein of unknown function (DUF2442)